MEGEYVSDNKLMEPILLDNEVVAEELRKNCYSSVL